MIREVSRKHGNFPDLCSELATQFTGDKERAKFLEQFRDQIGLAVPASSGRSAKAPTSDEMKSGTVWDSATLEKAKNELAVYIGPMAKLIVDSTASEAHTLKDFYDALCREIPSALDRERFLSRCKAGT